MFPAIRLFKRFLRVNVAELRKGDWIELETGRVAIVNNLASSHSGRGSRSFLLTVKDAATDSITTIKPTGRDTYERLELRDVGCKYLYAAEDAVTLIDERTLDEHTISSELIKPEVKSLLEDGMMVKLRMAQDRPVALLLPRITKCTVLEVLETSESTDKKLCVVRLSGGAKITCSVDMKVGDVINVDTEELSYQGRYKTQ